jgi:hypothetical protein
MPLGPTSTPSEIVTGAAATEAHAVSMAKVTEVMKSVGDLNVMMNSYVGEKQTGVCNHMNRSGNGFIPATCK